MRRYSIRSSVNLTDEHAERLRELRGCDMISSLFSCFGLVTATVDYELRYAKSRTEENCDVRADITEMCRWLCLFFSLLAGVFVLEGFRVKRRWMNVELGLGTAFDLSAIRQRVLLQPPEWKLLGLLGLDLLILAVFPYPVISDAQIRFHERVLYNDGRDFAHAITCYRLSELLYCFMFLRVFVLVRALLRYSIFADKTAALICYQKRARYGLRFILKALAKSHPQAFFLISFFLAVFLFALTCRVFERPYSYLSQIDFSPVGNSLWFCISTLYTAPYGDYFTQTSLGRAVSFTQCCAAICFVAVAKVFMLDYVDLSPGERRAYETIRARTLAAETISACYRHYRAKQLPVQHPSRLAAQKHAHLAARKFAIQFPALKDEVGLSETDAQKSEKVQQIETIEDTLHRIGAKVTLRAFRLERRLRVLCCLAQELQSAIEAPPLA